MTREELVVAEAVKMQDAHRMADDLRNSREKDEGDEPDTGNVPGAPGDEES